jgi:hypothetical protein
VARDAHAPTRRGAHAARTAPAALPLAAVAVALLGACGGAAKPAVRAAAGTTPPNSSSVAAPPPPPPVSARDRKLIARTLKTVSALRGLQAKREVPGATLSREQLIARVKAHVAVEVPREAIRREGLVLQLLGLIPTKFDYEAETYALLEAQLAGYYEPADGYMYLANDLDEDNSAATLAHELVHALQDHHYDLKERSKYRPGQGDLSLASSALAEGDATSVMVDVLVRSLDPEKTALDLPGEVFSEQILASVNMGGASHVPRVMKASLVAPYVDGTLFVNALRRKGGWPAVDRAWKNPPTTSEQILHVEKWEAHEPALDVPEPTGAQLGAGWSVADRDTYGELGTRLAVAEWASDRDAKVAAEGWGGDRGVLFANGAQSAFAWKIRYDTEAFAVRAHKILGPGLESKVGKPAAADASAGFACIERKELGPLAYARRGRDVVVTAGPAKTAAPWASAGDCALAKRWITSLLP